MQRLHLSFLAFLMSLFIFSGCTDEASTITPLKKPSVKSSESSVTTNSNNCLRPYFLTGSGNKEWRYKSLKLNGEEILTSCEADDVWQFFPDYTSIVDYNVKCTEDQQDIEYPNWRFNEDFSVLTIYDADEAVDFNIVFLNRYIIVATQEIEGFGTLTYTLKSNIIQTNL